MANEGDTRLALPVREAARRLSISESGAWNLIRRGELRATRIGGRTLLAVRELERYVALCTAPREAK